MNDKNPKLIHIGQEELKAKFANRIDVCVTFEEFCLDIFHEHGPSSSIKLIDRVSISLSTAKTLAKNLKEQIDSYEKRYQQGRPNVDDSWKSS